MFVLDHLKLTKCDPRELKKFRTLVRSMEPGMAFEVTILHERDNSCCRREAWHLTLGRLTKAIKPASLTIEVDVGGSTP
jgi:hypothetical protein